jgi:hypothetical protein
MTRRRSARSKNVRFYGTEESAAWHVEPLVVDGDEALP